MEIITSLIGLAILVLVVLAVLMPWFVYRICNHAEALTKSANEQMQWNKSQLEAQNLILQELYNIRTK